MSGIEGIEPIRALVPVPRISKVRVRAVVTASIAEKPLDFNTEMIGHTGFLRAYAKSLTGKTQEVDDLVQQTFTRALAGRDSFILGSNMRGWLVTIMKNSFRDRNRKNRVRIVEAFESELEHSDLPLHTLPAQHSALELKQTIDAMEFLPKKRKEALMLVGHDGHGYEEAAEIMGIPVGTVKSLVSRARKDLLEILKKKKGSKA